MILIKKERIVLVQINDEATIRIYLDTEYTGEHSPSRPDLLLIPWTTENLDAVTNIDLETNRKFVLVTEFKDAD